MRFRSNDSPLPCQPPPPPKRREKLTGRLDGGAGPGFSLVRPPPCFVA